MKIIITSSRIVLGLIFTGFSLAYFFNLLPQQPASGATLTFLSGLGASVYIMPLVKALELACGLAFLSGRLVPLALVVIFPIVINIVLFHVFLEPSNLLMPIVILASNIFLAVVYRERYQGVLQWK